MKGIGKVFLGLVFLTLFCVGFNVNVKAAPKLTVKVVDGDQGWKDGTTLQFLLDGDDDCFPKDQPGEYTYTYTLQGASVETYTIKFITDADLKHKIQVGETTEESSGKFQKVIGSVLSAEDVKGKLKGDGDTKTLDFAVTKEEREGGGGESDLKDASKTITSYKVDLKTNELAPSDVKFDKSDLYLLPGETSKVKASSATIDNHSQVEADGTKKAYRYLEWSKGDSDSITITKVEGSNNEYNITMPSSDPKKGTVTANFGTVALKFEKPLTIDVVLHPGDEFGPSTLTVTADPTSAAYKSDDLTNVYINSSSPSDKSLWSWGTGGFTFKVPSDAAADDEADLILEMSDGNCFVRHFKLETETPPTGEYTVTVKVSGDDSAKAEAVNSKTGDRGTTIYADKDQTILLVADEENFVNWTTSTSGVTIDDEESFENASFTMPAKNVTITANYTGEDPGIEVKDPIEVIVGQGILLSHFVDDVDNITSVSGDGKYINSKVEKQSNGDYLVTGKSSTSGKEVEGITINGTEYKVLVHPLPTLSTDNDIDEIITSTLPVHVRYDDVDEEKEFDYDVKYGTIAYKRDGEKYRYTSKYELSGSSSGHGTITLDWYDISSDLKNLYSTDKEEMDLELHSFPLNGNSPDANITDTDNEDLTVYRIKLLTSSGAKYKVNDKELDGSDPVFYAVEDTEYEIKASAKDSGSLKYWEINGDKDDSTSETKKFTANKSRTYKAVYSTSSSSSSSSSSYYSYSSSSSSTYGRTTAAGGAGSSGSGGDYDDVPKTGESKTDIWILWSVLLASILGAGFMIYKRFGLVRAIAEADREEAEAVHQEMVEKQEKDKENMISTLKGLRKL